jgi:hypothetical protein
MLPSRVAAHLKTSVTLNGLAIPFTQAVGSLARFCRPIALFNEGSDFELSMAGSAVAVRVLGQNVLVSSLHQLGKGASERDPGDAVMIIDTEAGQRAITGNEASRLRLGPAGQLSVQDVFILRFDDRRDDRDLRPWFCRLDIDQFKSPVDLPAGSKILAYIAIGFPSAHQVYGFEWDEETSSVTPGDIRSRWVRVFLEETERTAWDKDGLLPFQIDAEQTGAIGDLDGLSGSPILMLYQEADLQAHFAIAGMILWGNSLGRINAYPGGLLQGALRQLAESRRSARFI